MSALFQSSPFEKKDVEQRTNQELFVLENEAPRAYDHMNPSVPAFVQQTPVATSTSGHAAHAGRGTSGGGRRGRGGRGRGRRGRQGLQGRRGQSHDARQSQDDAAPAREAENARHADDDDYPSCLLCCEPMRVVAYGACNHKAACEKCLLRLRICYKNYACPMCKHPKDEIVIAPYREELPDFAEFKASRRPASRIVNQLGDGVVYVDKHIPVTADDSKPSHASSTGSTLLNRVLNMVGRSCPACTGPLGPSNDSTRLNKTFKTNKALMDHMREYHPNRLLCRMCLDEGRVFVLDQAVFTSQADLIRHKKESHPSCKFCRTGFYDGDGLFYHLVENHFQCTLCQRDSQRAPDGWFRNAPELQLHLANEHFACEHDVCRGALVAFLTLEELQRHHMDQHSGRIGRWDSQNARRLDFDFSFNTGGVSNAASRRVQFERESRGGLEVIDDHDFSAFPSLPASERTGVRASLFPSLPTSRAFSRLAVQDRPRGRNEEQFPSLGGSAASSAPVPDSARQNRPLVSVRVKCACGRKKSSKVIEEGDAVPKLECDGICRLEGSKEDRQKQLDDAFGIDSASHTSRFEFRQVDWGADAKRAPLLQAAKADPRLIKDYESLLEEFLRSSAARKVLAPAPKKHRMVLHHMAEAYGLSSVSMGAEPNRSVQLFKPLAATASTSVTKAGLPNPLLSQYILGVTAQEIEALVQASRGYQIRFTDVAKTADLHHHIRSSLSDYGVDVDNDAFSLEWEDDLRTSCIASFSNPSLVSAIRERLQGGIRGVFRIDYL